MGQQSPSDDALASATEAVPRKVSLSAESKKLTLMQDIGKALSSGLDLDHLLALIMEKITLLMEADRSTLFLVSDDGTELWSKVLQGNEVLEIRLKVGEGIAGWVAKSGETVNIPDAYIDERFQPAVDLRSGYRTRSILCMPMRNSLGTIIGVVQVLNKQDGPFTEPDEELLGSLAAQAAVSIENSKLYHSVVAKNVELLDAQEKLKKRTFELNVLYEIEKEVSAAHDIDELLDRVLRRAMAILGAESGAIALRDENSGDLIFRTAVGGASGRVRRKSVRMGEGVIGWSAAKREAVNVIEPGKDERHAAEFADSVGLKPRNIVCAPLVAQDVVLGAIELLDKVDIGDNREGGSAFTQSDLKLLVLIAGQATKAIQMAQAKREYENQNRLASIGQMLAGVLHDLKTPMTIISGYAQLMAQIDEMDQREHYVEQILRQFDLMGGMTREVLAFARGETKLLVRKVYLHRFLDEVINQLRHELAGRGVEVSCDMQYNGVAYFDQQKMLRLVHNLARNAAQAMGDGGRFLISVDSTDDHLVFEFTDDGPGIPNEVRGRLFEMFVSGSEGGTGLGLAICKKIIDEHGGTISYESIEGQGTTFHVQLPHRRAPGQQEPAAAEKKADSGGDAPASDAPADE